MSEVLEGREEAFDQIDCKKTTRIPEWTVRVEENSICEERANEAKRYLSSVGRVI